ncbi:MAG: DUF2062 domain-containing protein [Lentisphaeria bacterium]|nr:DUF2062 domain-containing protein [Lentisphaeria bacterium]
MSGAGSNAEVLLQSFAGGDTAVCAVLFTDAPDSSRCIEIGKKYDVPVESLDIRKFYSERGEDDIRLNSEHRRHIRDLWSEEVWKKLQPYGCDFLVFAGFVPLTNLAGNIPCLNVHPGDLTVEAGNRRIYAGLHYEPVERAILDGRDALRSSVILVQNYSGNGRKDLDGGPVLGISEPVPVDLAGFTLEKLQEIKAARTPGCRDDQLRMVAGKNIDRLKEHGDHVVLPQTVKYFASGRYGINDSGVLCLQGDNGIWKPVKTVEFSAVNPPEPVFLPGKKAAGRNKFIRFCKYMYTKMVRESGSPDYIARGWALGMFIGCVIPVFCQLVISVPLSFVFRGSKIGAALGTFITTPPTAVFIYPIQIWVGNKVINGSLSSDAAKKLLEIFNSETLSFAEKWSAFADLGWALVAAFFAGGLLWAMVMTPLTYFLVRFLVIRYREMRSRLFAAVKGKRGQS